MSHARWDKRRLKRAAILAAGVLVGVPVLVVGSCVAIFTWGNGIETTSMGPFTSTEELIARMPCFSGLDIERSIYWSRTRARRFEMVPAPGDAWYERWGEITLTVEGASVLRSAYQWAEVPRAGLPQVVQELGPQGERFMISGEFNESFDRENPSSSRNGFVLVRAGSDRRALYFFARDEEHGIDDEFPPEYWK